MYAYCFTVVALGLVICSTSGAVNQLKTVNKKANYFICGGSGGAGAGACAYLTYSYTEFAEGVFHKENPQRRSIYVNAVSQ